MQQEASSEVRGPGRPSRHPVTVRYCEDRGVNALMTDFAERQGMTFSEAQRIVNRAGLQALNILVPA